MRIIKLVVFNMSIAACLTLYDGIGAYGYYLIMTRVHECFDRVLTILTF